MAKHNIGDYVILTGLSGDAAVYNGIRVEVAGKEGIWYSSKGGQQAIAGYPLLTVDGGIICVTSGNIKADEKIIRRGDMDNKFSWDKCAWKPQHMRGI